MTIREWDPATDDAAFVMDSWIRDSRDDSRRRQGDGREVRDRAWYRGTRAGIDAILERGGRVLMTELEGALLGWLCYEPATPPVLHYAFVKPRYRKHGVFRKMLSAAGFGAQLRVSTLTRPVLRWKVAGRAIDFDPFAVWCP